MKSAYRTKLVDGADEDTADILRDLHDQTFGDTAPQINPEEGFWWLTYFERQPVAFCGLLPSSSWFNTGYLYRVGVLPEHRGKGLQRRLITVRELRARRFGWSHTVTDTTDNTPSANSLIRAGYVLFEPAVPWSCPTALYWKKQL